MNTFKPIKQIKVSNEVFQQLRDAIFDGQYLAGAKLPSERELIETFQVSRTVVREALKGLEARGLVDIKQGATGGAFVKKQTYERLSNDCKDLFLLGQMSYAEICQARLAIAPIVAGLAAQHGTDEARQQLQQLSQHCEPSDRVSQVYHQLAMMCNNRFLTAIDQALIQLIADVDNPTSINNSTSHPDMGVVDEIHTLVDAVLSCDPSSAEQAMRAHLQAHLSCRQPAPQSDRDRSSE